MPPPRRFLFLQGPISPFFSEVAAGLRALGHAAHRINLCLGDRLFWRGPGAVDFRGRAEDWPAFVGAFLDRHAITDLVLLGEQRPLHRAAIAEARGRGVAVAVTDFGYLRPDWVVLERDGMGAESRFPRDPAAIRALAARCPEPDLRPRFADDFAAQARWDMRYHLASLAPWPFRHYRRFLLHHPVPAYLGTGWRLLPPRGGDAARRRPRRRAARGRGAALPLRHADGNRLLRPRLFALPRQRHRYRRGGGELRPRGARRGAPAGEAPPARSRAEALAEPDRAHRRGRGRRRRASTR